ncbi:tagatose-6-phosphate ketose isomerase [Thermoanaerobacterium thermosaccharolyticum]|uniref:Tagatose-6-phosphate ketose isomerase n=1 Tax=Thermoanaerobacterium thermosaccharolyticum TaxID=1517 RepID=A0A231VAW8_THETR|nr:SIS domain-containing protein [Thermoanaerobacterium thermosaccharolyticum]AST56598.1 tagatose-6-phosphate ketose isomerase [Thermoanaerobacterium thermosaccharolyticum]OXT05322.1 tagatose-6-phosphate ketose isomerase [Thermoanaerobacterium thermosaccharolyticum]
MLLRYSEEELKERKGYATAKEIEQQPRLWRELYDILLSQKSKIAEFLKPILAKKDLKIILTGAGTSAFVGDSSEGYLRRMLKKDVEAIDTTDIVAKPQNFFFEDKPTLLISHARSGDSPESLATIELAEKIIKDVYFLNITCNKDGKMAKGTIDKKNCLNIFMPEESNDDGFAMTSSFTCMLLTDLMLPHIEEIENEKDIFEKLASEAERILKEDAKIIEEISRYDYDRLIYLGSGDLKGCATEAALKSLELSHGDVNTNSNTPLGFRHGPKSAINDTTLLGFFVSNDTYTQKYDLDLIQEIANEPGKRKLMVFLTTNISLDGIDYIFRLKQDFSKIEEAFLTPLYIIYAQMLGFYKSLNLGITPDNPNPEGRVNRVVKGVTIYDYKS